jgi:hypothetical protein
MAHPRNTDPFAPWNDPMYRDDPFAPHNEPHQKDDPTKPWNDPSATERDLSRSEKQRYGRRSAWDEED